MIKGDSTVKKVEIGYLGTLFPVEMVRQFKTDFKFQTVHHCACNDDDEPCGAAYCKWCVLTWPNTLAAMCDEANEMSDGNSEIVCVTRKGERSQHNSLSLFGVNG